MANLKQLSELPSRLAPGHRLCGGCGASIAVRQVLMGAGDTPVVVSSARWNSSTMRSMRLLSVA